MNNESTNNKAKKPEPDSFAPKAFSERPNVGDGTVFFKDLTDTLALGMEAVSAVDKGGNEYRVSHGLAFGDTVIRFARRTPQGERTVHGFDLADLFDAWAKALSGGDQA